MTRSELEHVVRASGAIADDAEIVVIGSQSILGAHPDAPPELCASMEADVFPRNHPERAGLVDGAIGEASHFHEQFGYYAQGVGPETAILPSGWQERLVPVRNPNTNGITGQCLEVHDLALSKYAAHRPKDREFTRDLARYGMTTRQVLLERLRLMDLPEATRAAIAAAIERDFKPGD
jgi:hypothetical protein